MVGGDVFDAGWMNFHCSSIRNKRKLQEMAVCGPMHESSRSENRFVGWSVCSTKLSIKSSNGRSGEDEAGFLRQIESKLQTGWELCFWIGLVCLVGWDVWWLVKPLKRIWSMLSDLKNGGKKDVLSSKQTKGTLTPLRDRLEVWSSNLLRLVWCLIVSFRWGPLWLPGRSWSELSYFVCLPILNRKKSHIVVCLFWWLD